MKSRVKNNCIVVLLIAFNFACSEKHEEKPALLLPVLGAKQPSNPEGTDTIYHKISKFSLTNQYKETINETTTANKIYVANFFFATCQSICPQMSTQISRLQEEFKNDNDFLVLSHSVNPIHDTAEVLLTYAGKYKAIKNKWHFLTGNKKTIYDLAKNDYLVNALEDDGTPEGFLHSELFLLIDKQSRIRGMFDGTDSIEVNKLIEQIKLLKTEKN
jgi:protein SCO1/2